MCAAGSPTVIPVFRQHNAYAALNSTPTQVGIIPEVFWEISLLFPYYVLDKINSSEFLSPLQYATRRNRNAKLTSHLQLMPRSRVVGLYLYSPYVFMTWCLLN
jgi:hypothetical protein